MKMKVTWNEMGSTGGTRWKEGGRKIKRTGEKIGRIGKKTEGKCAEGGGRVGREDVGGRMRELEG